MAKGTVERRSPERQHHTMQLLRRLSAGALIASLILLVAPRMLAYFGLIGPTVEERIEEAEQALRAAESYGAKAGEAAAVAARQELAAARRHAREGNAREARAAAARAAERAREAQATALVGEGAAERQAQAVADDLDAQVNEIENMYEALAPSLTREGRSALLKKMRSARKSAAGVFLARDEKRFADALGGEAEARRALAETRAALEAAGAPRATPRPAASTPVDTPTASPPPSSGAGHLPIPFESEGACPFECCTYRRWTVERETAVRAARDAGAPVAFTLRPGDSVDALTGVVVVSEPGRARAPRDVPVEGLGTLRAGDEVAVLHPLGEGFWLVWRDGKKGSAQVGEKPAPGPGGPEVLQTRKPRFRWWVQVRDAKGHVGWTDAPENFGNKDRCA